MKTIRAVGLPIVFAGLCLGLWGCAWSHSTEGSVFDGSDINQIVKGKTTTTDLMNILGTPYAKTPEADGGEKWYYYCSHNSDSVGMLVPAPVLVMEKKSTQKNDLVVMVNKDKVVVDYKLSEGATVKQTDAAFIVTPLAIPIPVYSSTQNSTNSKPEAGSSKQ